MLDVAGKQVTVLGLNPGGMAAAELLLRKQARVGVVEPHDRPDLRELERDLSRRGVTVRMGAKVLAGARPDLAVVTAGLGDNHPLVEEARRKSVECISELELSYRECLCLTLAVTGTNGKSSTGRLLAALLQHEHRRTVLAGPSETVLCEAASQSRNLDFLIAAIPAGQLTDTRYFRPVVAVVTNLTPDGTRRSGGLNDYVQQAAKLFANQQAFDWAIVQSEAMARMRALDVCIPSKVITFSAANRRADIYLERGLLVSRLPDWPGPLLDIDQCRLRGQHQAENLMAALAAGHVLRIPLDQMAETLRSQEPQPGCCELIAEIQGVRYINDGRSRTVDALQHALQAAPAASPMEPNVWLIAGGADQGAEYYDVGPHLSRRVKGAFLYGAARDKIRAAWSLFTPCAVMGSLLEAVTEAAQRAVVGDVVLLSPASAGWDMFQSEQLRVDTFRRAVEQWASARGTPVPGPDAGHTPKNSNQ